MTRFQDFRRKIDAVKYTKRKLVALSFGTVVCLLIFPTAWVLGISAATCALITYVGAEEFYWDSPLR